MTIAFAVLVALIFIALGTAKLLALPMARELATHSGFSVSAYRGIGALELAGAAGVLAGLALPLLGGLAGAGLLLLLAGALITHLRNQHALQQIAPALVCALLVIGYLVVLL
ncbi:DoxX family protein [Lentzea sp. NPDC006480]|uniref:DoxX family protein n=1 Tax=Lentzea sp. NPDC006480 TaxID=3157176 RepID=UPI0033B17E0F